VIRAISYTEGSTMLRCQAQHDFQYGDRLAGSSLRPKDTPTILREGRAWGRAVAALHETGDLERAQAALGESLMEEDADGQREAGTFDREAFSAMSTKLLAIVGHYALSASILPLERPEHELLVPLPSRSGKGSSNRYKLHTFFDGLHTDEHGRVWIVEFKLRGRLSSVEQIANSRQVRYYAWAWFIATGQRVAGVIVDERLNEIPKPARILKSGKPSHAKDQLCTPEAYEQACLDAEEGPRIDVMEALEARRWQQRVPIFLTDAEVDEAGTELVSLAKQIQALDAHDVYPVRDVRAQNCNGCRFRDICNHPEDADLVDALFDRVPPKRDRDEIQPTPTEEVVA
jgi:hypothetical protein